MLIDHDIHIHTTLSLCAEDDSPTVDNYVRCAKDLGLKTLGFANHLWDHAAAQPTTKFYQVQDVAYVDQLRPELERAAKETDVKLLFGCETEYCWETRDIALTEESARRYDFILVPNSHTHIVMPKEFYASKERHARFMLDAFMDIVTSPLAKYVTAIAHPFSAVCCPYDNRLLYPLISQSQYREAFCAAKEAGIAIELNYSSYRRFNLSEFLNHPSMEMFEIAKDCGCKFTFGSDSHSALPAGDQAQWHKAYVFAARLGITEADLDPFVRG